jgi:hypothetical protein
MPRGPGEGERNDGRGFHPPPGDKDRLIAALIDWADASEGLPRTPADAALLKAMWHYVGDDTEPCPGCAGDCGEPCAPITVAAAQAELDRFTDAYRRRRGGVVVLRSVP